MSIRLTAQQDAAIRERAARFEVSDSEALRQLLDLGVMQDAITTTGLVVTAEAGELIRDGHGAAVAFVHMSDPIHEEELAALELPRDAVEGGRVVLCSTEQARALVATGHQEQDEA